MLNFQSEEINSGKKGMHLMAKSIPLYSKMVPDASVGAYLYSKHYFISFSSHQLFESTFKESITSIFGDNDDVRHYYANWLIPTLKAIHRVQYDEDLDDLIKTIVMGVNDDSIEERDTILSNASCTTNSAAPMIHLVEQTIFQRRV